MTNFILFCALFCLFMWRASLFEWRSAVSDSPWDDLHAVTFVLFALVSLAASTVVKCADMDLENRLKTEYKDVFVPPAAFLRRTPASELGEPAFSDKAKCECDAD